MTVFHDWLSSLDSTPTGPTAHYHQRSLINRSLQMSVSPPLLDWLNYSHGRLLITTFSGIQNPDYAPMG